MCHCMMFPLFLFQSKCSFQFLILETTHNFIQSICRKLIYFVHCDLGIFFDFFIVSLLEGTSRFETTIIWAHHDKTLEIFFVGTFHNYFNWFHLHNFSLDRFSWETFGDWIFCGKWNIILCSTTADFFNLKKFELCSTLNPRIILFIKNSKME